MISSLRIFTPLHILNADRRSASVNVLRHCYFATDKTPFISEKSPKAIFGYIIGSLKMQRCKTTNIFAIPFRKYTLFQIMNQPKLWPGSTKKTVVKSTEKAKEDAFKCLLTNSSTLHCKQFVLPSFSTCACPRPKK